MTPPQLLAEAIKLGATPICCAVISAGCRRARSTSIGAVNATPKPAEHGSKKE